MDSLNLQSDFWLFREGVVWTFGCNDEGSLGRLVEEEEDCFVPGKVDIGEKVGFEKIN